MSGPAAASPEQQAALEILRSVRRIEISSRRLVREVFSGSYHTVFKGRGIEFSEVREYVPGDDVRSIDWNVTARMDRPFVKQFHEERERTVVFVVDRSASTRFGSGERPAPPSSWQGEASGAARRGGRRGPAFDPARDGRGSAVRGARTLEWVAAETTALLALSAAANQDKVGLLLFSDRLERWVPARKGRSHILRIVRDVLFHRPEGTGTSLRTALERASRTLRRRSLVFLISDFVGAGDYETALGIAARKHEVVPVVLVDPHEEELPRVGLVEIVDLETGKRRMIDTSDPRERREMAMRVDRMRRAREEAFRRAGVEGVVIRLDRDTVEPLVRYFRRRERWRAAGR